MTSIFEPDYHEIVERYVKKRESLAAIAADYGRTGQALGYYLRSSGLATRVGGGQYTPEALKRQNEQILDLWERGYTKADLAAAFLMSESAMSERVDRIRKRQQEERSTIQQ